MTEKNSKNTKLPKTKALTEVVTKGGARHVEGFFDFIRTQGVVGLAVGLAIGTAAGDTVRKMVSLPMSPMLLVK